MTEKWVEIGTARLPVAPEAFYYMTRGPSRRGKRMTSTELKAAKEKTSSRAVKRALVALYHAENHSARGYVARAASEPHFKMANIYLDTFLAEKANLTGGQAAELARIIEGQFTNAMRAKAERNGGLS